jgi:hypothetical protein
MLKLMAAATEPDDYGGKLAIRDDGLSVVANCKPQPGHGSVLD